MDKLKKKKKNLQRRHMHIRHKVVGTTDRPRLCVFKSAKHLYCQIINDREGVTICSASTLTPEIRKTIEEERQKAAKLKESQPKEIQENKEEKEDKGQKGQKKGKKKKEDKGFTKTRAAALVGQQIAKIAEEKGVKKVVFDRGGFKYHGRLKALADSARKAGLSF